jgi:hypothetical protein
MAQHPEGDVTLEEACARNGLTLIGQVRAWTGTAAGTARPCTLDVVASEYGPAVLLPTAEVIYLSPEEGAELADVVFDAVLKAREMAADPDVRAMEHARQMVEGLGLTWVG